MAYFRQRLRHKYKAIPCKIDNIRFSSKLETMCYQELKELKKEGEILFFLRQIPFDLPGGAKHFVDFCVFTTQNVVFIEAKGRDLPMGKLKRQQAEELYNIDIVVVKNAQEIKEILEVC